MPKAKVEAEVSANINPLKRAFEEAKEKLSEFGEKSREAGKEVETAFLGKDLSRLLGIGGAIVAIGALAERLKDFVSESLEGFGKLETKGLQLGLSFRNLELGKKGAEWASGHAGAMGSMEDISYAVFCLKKKRVTNAIQFATS